MKSSKFKIKFPVPQSFKIFLEFMGTIGVSFLVYLSLFFLIRETRNKTLKIFGIDQTLADVVDASAITFKTIFVVYTFLFILFLIGFLIWKTKKRTREIQIDHIFNHLRIFIQGNYEERIPTIPKSNLTDVIDDINHILEEFTQEVQKKQNIERNKDELITNISHDLRTPLTSILGYLSLVVNNHYNSTNEALQYVEIAYEKAAQMESLVNDLFEYTASRQPSYTLHYQRTHLELFLNQIMTEFMYLAHDKNTSIQLEINPVDLEIDIDIEKIARVYQNLISNALKYGHKMSVITLTAAEFKEKHENWIQLEVKNDGKVIPKEELELIFNRSYRADQARSSDEVGAGLGLAITKNIITLHGGEVYATVTNDETIFTMELPKHAPNRKGDIL